MTRLRRFEDYFILLPYAVDVPFDRRPFVNWALVITVVAAFLFQIPALTGQYGAEEKLVPYMLDGWDVPGLFTHMWLHADPIHLGGNMLFLWVFGNAVCAKIGNLKFLPIYLLLGLFAATAHNLFTGGTAVGASGAINGIVGMYLIFFWQNDMDCVFCGMLMLRPVHRTFSVPSYVMILLWLVFDIWGAVAGGGRVAYFAHLGGFIAGALLAILLLKLRWVTMYADEQSLIERFEQWRQDRLEVKLVRIARDEIDKAHEGDPNWRAELDEPIPEQSTEPEIPMAKPVEADPQNKPAILHFACPCGKKIQAPLQHAGKTGRCPQCKQSVTIPIPTAEELT
ncbi:MAG: rhomboid family intramembrane serine protease [Planctomycetota bacterium]